MASAAIDMLPVGCPQCGCFGVLKKPGDTGHCMQCGWVGPAKYEPPIGWKPYRYVQVCGKEGPSAGEFCELAPKHDGECKFRGPV